MRNLIIIGAGGMGRTIYDMALENNGYLKDFQIKGFIDDDIHQLDRFGNYPPIISTILDLSLLPKTISTSISSALTWL